MLGFYRLNRGKIFVREVNALRKRGIDLSFLEGKPIEYPNWDNNYARLKSWAWKIGKRFRLPEIVIKTELLFPEKDMRYIETYPLERIRELWDYIEIFGDSTAERTIYWYLEIGHRWIRNDRDLAKINLLIMNGAWPETYRQYRRLRSSMILTEDPKEVVIKMYQCSHLDKWDMALLGMRGYINNKEKELIKHIKKVSREIYYFKPMVSDLFKLKTNILKQINLKYFEIKPKESITLGSLMKAGVKLKDLFPRYTKKERKKIASNCINYSFPMIEISAIAAIFRDKLPAAWLQYINSPEVARWAIEKKDQLSRHRIVHGPGGTTARFEYHLILSKVTPEMLTQGPKTSFRKIWEEIGQQELELTKALVGKKVEFKTLPFPEKWEGKITPLTNSVELFEEGEKMSHCVGGRAYQEACIRGISYIYHVGNPAPEGATFEISKHNREKYELCQIYAYNDAPPKKEEIIMAEKFVKDINELIEERR